MGIAIAVILVVQIGMGINLQDVQVGVMLGISTDDGVSDGMVAAEREGTAVPRNTSSTPALISAIAASPYVNTKSPHPASHHAGLGQSHSLHTNSPNPSAKSPESVPEPTLAPAKKRNSHPAVCPKVLLIFVLSFSNLICIIFDMSDIVIRTEGLRKEYKEVTAVSNLTFQVHDGEIFGLLGPNGAGKTTTISMLLGLIRPSAGYAEIMGYDIRKDTTTALRQVGALVEAAFYPYLSAYDNLWVMTQMSGGNIPG